MLSNEKWFGASADFYKETIDQSLRFDRASSSYLRRTGISSSGTNQKKVTISMWLKLSQNTSSSLYNIISQGSNNNNRSVLYFYNSQFRYDHIVSSANNTIVFSPKLRDFTNFYHIAVTVDMTQSSNADKVHFYLNGVRQSISSSSYVSTNTDTYFNGTNDVSLGTGSTIASLYDGYMAEINMLDGITVGATQNSNGDYILDEFGQVKNGVWIPKAYSGSYGTNGFRLTFGNSSAIGEDSAGSNDFDTVSNIDANDIVLDSPTNNFATALGDGLAEPSDYQSYNNPISSEGNLKITAQTGWTNGSSNFGMTSGKWYAECRINAVAGSNYIRFGMRSRPARTYDEYFWTDNGGGQIDSTTSPYSSRVGTYSAGDILQIALDLENNALYFGKNGTWENSATATEIANGTVTNAFASGTTLIPNAGADGDGHAYFFYCNPHPSGSNITWNFGQDSSFAGLETAQGNSDSGDGTTDFYYTPPTGFLACNSVNLLDTTISPNQDTQAEDHFNTVLYTGNGTSQSITGVGFQPDWVWFKSRDDGSLWHYLLDSSRGGTKRLYTNGTGAESTNANAIQSFDSDGFSVGSASNINASSDPIVAWNWKAGGSTPSKTYKVVVVSDSGNKYRFRNSADSATFAQSAVTLDLQEGGTYVFDWSDSTAQGHPIRFSTTSDGTHGSGSEYTTGVVKDDSAYKTTITVAGSAPTLYYYCANHSGMGGQINTNTTHGSTNFDGSILSVEQSNTTAGFSIVTYTGNLTAGATYGHGLGTAPDIVITKIRSATGKWIFLTTAEPTKYNYLNQTSAFTTLNLDDRFGNNTSVILPSSTVVTIGTNLDVNTSGATYISYCFSEIEGYSKFGSYTGNGSTDGTYIHLGFRASWIMIKRTNGTGQWFIMDNKRIGYNGANYRLLADASSVEYTGTSSNIVDFLSNGFKCRTTSSNTNGSSDTYIYMAFAEQPFKFSNAR